MVIRQIATSLSSVELFSLFKDRKYCFFLDSALVHEGLGQFSWIGFDPPITIQSKNGQIEIHERNGYRNFESDPFSELQILLNQYTGFKCIDFPFVGGAVGYFGYDLCHHVEKLPKTTIDDLPVPDCFFGIYDGVIIIDHYNGTVHVSSPGLLVDADSWVDEVESIIHTGFVDRSSASESSHHALKMDLPSQKATLVASGSKANYLEAVQRIKNYIESGDIYQANLTRRFVAQFDLPPFETYIRLRTLNPAPFAAYLDFGSGHILSSSPERLIRIRNGRAQTRPIKGTRPRGKTPEEDTRYRLELINSEKDRSELLMIVDLERNDLGRVCRPGSVQVTELFELEEYATVYHLVSTIEGALDTGVDAIDCLKAVFPGGSITGAPKIRAMEIIDELEPVQRGIYTGAIGYIGFDGQADFNIAIRTIIMQQGKVFFSAGGGIVWDSDPIMEYEETIHKVSALINALNAELCEGDPQACT